MNILQIENVSKKYGDFTALREVSMEIPENTIFGLLGPNGAGKTTLIRIINQITGPDTGKVYFKEQLLKPEHTSNIGYLPEERGLYRKMKVGEQALYLAQLKNLSRTDALKRLKMLFDKFEIGSWWNKKVEELSKGMQQKVQFIVTIVHEPELLIFDEPFSGFDPINVNLLKDEILQLREKGSTIIFSTHNMSSVEELCDYFTLLNKAEKILEGKVYDVKTRFKSNLWQLEYVEKDGNPFSGSWEEVEVTSAEKLHDNINRLLIKLPENTSINRILQNVLPQIELKKIEEILPSMNDIFIQSVQKDKKL